MGCSTRDSPNNNENAYECIICGKRYLKEISLYVHIVSHTEDILAASNNSNEKKINIAKNSWPVSKSKCHHYDQLELSAEMSRMIQPQVCTNLAFDKLQLYRNTNKENRIPQAYSDKSKSSFHLGLYDEEKTIKRGKTEMNIEKDFECRSERHYSGIYQCNSFNEQCKHTIDCSEDSKNHHGPSYLKCDSCNKVYPTDNHNISESSEIKTEENVCNFCGRTLSICSNYKSESLDQNEMRMELSTGKALDSTRNTHVYNSYECDNCKQSFSYKKDLLYHLEIHMKEDGKHKDMRPISKPKDVTCKSEEIEFESGKVKCIISGKRKKNNLEKPYKCDAENCTYAAAQYSLLKSHKFKHKQCYKCVTCQEIFSSRLDLKNHMSTHGERPFKCDQCSKSYKDKHGLGWHKKVQHDPSRLKFTCELCGKTYPFVSLLTQHINLTHAAEKQSVCDICGKNVSKTYLPMHRRTHGEKQYFCEVCEKPFLEKAYLKRHRMVHTGEKPYVCSVCGNSFRQHSTLTIHMRTHTGDRPYKCILCDNAYKTHHNLKKHYKRSGHKLV